MTTQTFIPHSRGQHDYVCSESRFNIVSAGRRWGKSTAAHQRLKDNSLVIVPTGRMKSETHRLSAVSEELDILMVSAADIKMAAGLTVDHVLIMEAAYCDSVVWDAALAAIRDTKGTCDIVSTPMPVSNDRNWFCDLFENPPEDSSTFRFATWDNPICFPGGSDDPEIQRLKQLTSSEYFNSQYAAKFS